MCICIIQLSHRFFYLISGFIFTYTCWQGVIPLCQVVWDALAPYGSRAVQDVTRVALELHQGANCKVITETFPKARLRD